MQGFALLFLLPSGEDLFRHPVAGYRRNPDEVKIKGHDYDFLRWALEESQRRTVANRIRRKANYYLRRYASPRKVVRKIGSLLGS